MAIKTISQFDAATPASNDKILFEQNGEGKSSTIRDAVNACSLSYEEIMASTDLSELSGKVASASGIKSLNNLISNTVNTIVANNRLHDLLKGGVNSIKIESGTSIGSYTAPNNLRGIAVRDGTNIIGFVISFNCAEAYIISCDNASGIWNYARKI